MVLNYTTEIKTNTHVTSSSRSSEVACTYRHDLLQHKPVNPWETVTDFWSIDLLEGNRSGWWAITGDLTSIPILLWDQCAGSPSINISFEDGSGEEPSIRVPDWINLGLNESLVSTKPQLPGVQDEKNPASCPHMLVWNSHEACLAWSSAGHAGWLSCSHWSPKRPTSSCQP